MKVFTEDPNGPLRFEELPQEIQSICTSLLDRLKVALNDNLHGVYLYGAMVFPETRYVQDIDFHITVKRQLTAREKEEIWNLHNLLALEFPRLGAELDGYYILLSDAQQISPPRHQVYQDLLDETWALHRAHMRADYCIVLHGPDPSLVFPEPTWEELVFGLKASLKHTVKYLDRYPDYCILNFCRMVYSYSTKNVVISKRAAAEWGLENFPKWRHLIEAALRVYEREDKKEDQRLLKSEIEGFYQFVRDKIEESNAE